VIDFAVGEAHARPPTCTLTTGSYGIENLILEGYAIYIILDI
jgi:hypothetical protein